MNQVHLGRYLGAVSPIAFQRFQNEQLINSLTHEQSVTFTSTAASSSTARTITPQGTQSSYLKRDAAHQAGVNCLTIDDKEGRYLVSGGADASIRLWNLEDYSSQNTEPFEYRSKASLSRNDKLSHTHAITSISIYPFDPTPQTLLTTSHDKTLKVTSITPSSLTPIHTFPLDFAPYTHAVSPLPESPPLIAVGTAHPAIRLLDLRSGLSTHSLPAHNGAVYSVSWSPKQPHILASGAHDGRVLFFDVRRANAVFASLDLDDAIGVLEAGPGARQLHLDWRSQAHSGPVTSVQWTSLADKLVTTGHDQRIRIWDTQTGRNDLVHFGPRIRNDRIACLKPLISHARPGRELLFWPNDDGRGDVFVHSLREGNLVRVLRTHGVPRHHQQSSLNRLTSGGRINDLCWRSNAVSGPGVEMYSAHGDGRICVWRPELTDDEEVETETETEDQETEPGGSIAAIAGTQQTRNKKRKRDLVGEIIQGLTKKPLTF